MGCAVIHTEQYWVKQNISELTRSWLKTSLLYEVSSNVVNPTQALIWENSPMAVYCLKPKDISSSIFPLVLFRQLFINIVGDALQARDTLKKKEILRTHLLLQCLKSMLFVLELLLHVSHFSLEFINLQQGGTFLECYFIWVFRYSTTHSIQNLFSMDSTLKKVSRQSAHLKSSKQPWLPPHQDFIQQLLLHLSTRGSREVPAM